MFKLIIYAVFMIFIIAVVGSILLEQFPQLIPLWNEFKSIVTEVYQSSKVKYGSIATIAIVAGVVILVGTSKKI